MSCAQGWDLRLIWLQGLMDKVHNGDNELKEIGRWSPERLVGVMVDNFMSYNDLRNLRQALSLVYDKDMDRFMHPIWVVSPFEALFQRPRIVRWPEPIPPIEQIRACYKQYEAELKIAVSADGKVACHRFAHKAIELHQQHHSEGADRNGRRHGGAAPSHRVLL